MKRLDVKVTQPLKRKDFKNYEIKKMAQIPRRPQLT